MQPIKERQIKPYQCKHCPKSFKSSNGLKYHLEKVHFDEENKMEEGKSFFSMEGMIGRLCIFSLFINVIVLFKNERGIFHE